MDEKCHGNSIEIQAYIKNHSRLRHRSKSFYNEIVNIYGDNAILHRTVSEEQSNFVMGGSANVRLKNQKNNKKAEAKIKELLETDVRYTLRKLAWMTDI